MVLKRFLRIARGFGSKRRRVRRSMTVTSCLSSSINPLPAPSFLIIAERFFPPPPRDANTVLGLPTIASRGSMMHISRNISTFSMMNMPFAFATPLPRLNSKAASANWVRPSLRAGFCLRKVPRSSLSNLSQAMSHGSVNMKSSAFASSHSFCVNNEKLASAKSVQKSLTKSTDTSRNSEGVILLSFITSMSASLSSWCAVTMSKLRFNLSRDSRYSKWKRSRMIRMKSLSPLRSASGMSSLAISLTKFIPSGMNAEFLISVLWSSCVSSAISPCFCEGLRKRVCTSAQYDGISKESSP
mmetsp:Transcript_11477/g.44625  ORF Transcript_11477/g.44625 Transcript_11477/m.44625 type:complete len:299 (-) Transcript_11477:2-898(-)